MENNIKTFQFHFRNGGQWEVPIDLIGDVWISRVSTSFGRINGKGPMVKIHPAKSIQIEILPDADTIEVSADINHGSLETGMFETVVRNDDIEWLTIIWDNGDADEMYFPYEPSFKHGKDNVHMTAKIEENRHLYIVIDEEKNVDEVYPS